MDFCQILGPKQKALSINLDNTLYGAFAEIGAGQEVARYFFRAGGAAGTVAKTMSAYDMVISDTIYGREDGVRYVSEERLKMMLEHEYNLLVDRLGPIRGHDTRFFAFSNTVAAKSYSGKGECHGWLGVKFQHKTGASPSELIVHIRMLDQENIQQQEAVGLFGVNMLHSCFNFAKEPVKFVSSLMDNLTNRRIVIDMIRVNGEAFSGIDSRILSLELVKRKYTKAVMFGADGGVISATDTLYKKNVVVCRGSFRPPTLVNIDMLDCGKKMLQEEVGSDEPVVVLPEISMSKLLERAEQVNNADFLARVDLMAELGHNVLITNFDNYFELNTYLQFTKKKIAFITGVFNLEQILMLDNYQSTCSGIMGGLGELFGHMTKLYIYPVIDDNDNTKWRKIADLNFDKSIKKLVEHLKDNQLIIDVKDYDKKLIGIWSRTILAMIKEGKSGWEKMVPEKVAKKVIKDKLFMS